MYMRPWKIRNLRIWCWEMRLAVRLATAPFSNSSRAVAISAESVITGTPLARTSQIGDLIR